MSIPTITTPRLSLRAFSGEDVRPLHRIMGEKVVLSYFPNQDPPTLAKVEKLVSAQLQHWAEHGYGWWAVVPRGSVELIGWAGLQFLPETNETEVAYLLARPYWGRGLATEAARASLEFGFDRLDLTCIVGIVHPKNIASRRVLEKAGLSLAEQSHYFGMDCLRYVVCRPSGDAPLCAMASSPVPAE